MTFREMLAPGMDYQLSAEFALAEQPSRYNVYIYMYIYIYIYIHIDM